MKYTKSQIKRWGNRHKTRVDWVRQRFTQVRRWMPERRIILVTDGGLIAVKLGVGCQNYTVNR